MTFLAPPNQVANHNTPANQDLCPTFTKEELIKLRHSKQVLPPGHSQQAWLTRMRSHASAPYRKISVRELLEHNKIDDMWMLIRGKIYDVTPYVAYHPGGSEILLRGAGKDATQLYNSIHSFVNPDALLANYCIGVIG